MASSAPPPTHMPSIAATVTYFDFASRPKSCWPWREKPSTSLLGAVERSGKLLQVGAGNEHAGLGRANHQTGEVFPLVEHVEDARRALRARGARARSRSIRDRRASGARYRARETTAIVWWWPPCRSGYRNPADVIPKRKRAVSATIAVGLSALVPRDCYVDRAMTISNQSDAGFRQSLRHFPMLRTLAAAGTLSPGAGGNRCLPPFE